MDVTVILNAHREGCLARPTIRSLMDCLAYADERGVSTEVIVVLDNADADTIEQFRWHADTRWRLEHTRFSDTGQARNHGVRCANGRFISFLDADDLFSANWLAEAFRAATHEPRLAIWHSELNIYFGRDERVFYHVDMDQACWYDADVIASNPWTSLAFAPVSVLRDVPYPASDIPQQIGYEDWAWNEATVAAGAVHKVVPNTAHLIRVKRQGSVLAQTNGLKSICAPSGFIRQKGASSAGLYDT